MGSVKVTMRGIISLQFMAVILFQNVKSQQTVYQMAPLECYSCGSPQSKSCEEFSPNNPDYTEVCSSNKKSCIKTYGAFHNISVISMGCGDGQAMNRCTSMTLGGAEVTICTCDQNLCNKSGNLILDSKLIYFILFLISIANRIM